MIHIDLETPNDVLAREALLDRAMGVERVLKPSERLREGRLPAEGLALVAREGDGLVGSVRLWNVSAGGIPALLLGPLAADPAVQGRGVGSGLMQVALNRAE
ncbi:MAG: N-acetyltransferase, partial [Rhizobiales bacterium]|nr:N-acetyltransferase [Hyphomicrobiales bacterium]